MNSDLIAFLALMLPATLFLGAYDVVGKRLLGESLPGSLVVGVSFLFSGVLIAPALFVCGIPSVGFGFAALAAAIVTINLLSNLAWYSALSVEDASLLAPTRLLTPPMVLLTGYLFLGEVPGLVGGLGVLTTIGGLYLLLSAEATGKRDTIASVLKRRGVIIALICACTGAITFSLDKKAVAVSSPIFFTVVFFFGVGASSLAAYFVTAKRRTEDLKRLWRNRGKIVLLSSVHAAGALMSFASLSFTLAAYAASTKRLWSLFSVLLAGQVLKEKNIGRKVVAVIVMLAGIVIPLIWG